MSEDVLQKLNKQKEEREKTHATIKGMFEGIRLTRQSETDKGILKVLEFVIDGFKNTSDSFDLVFEGIYYMGKRVETLEKEVKQLQKTVDTFQENK
jgi:uncharacterized protein YoxC